MEKKTKTRETGRAEDITPRPLDCGIPPLGELLDALFRGFAPAGAKGEGDRP